MIFSSVCGSGRPTVCARSSAASRGDVCVITGDASVCANTIDTGAPNSASTRPTRAGATTAPPVTTADAVPGAVEVLVVKHADEHGRHAEQGLGPLCGDELQH
jgi:hypothetical protein